MANVLIRKDQWPDRETMKPVSCLDNEHTLLTTNVGGGILRHTCVRCSLVSIEPVARHHLRPVQGQRRSSRPARRNRFVRVMERDLVDLPHPAA